MALNRNDIFSPNQLRLVSSCIRKAIRDEKHGVIHMDTGMFIVQYPERWCTCGHSQSWHMRQDEMVGCDSCLCSKFRESAGSKQSFAAAPTDLTPKQLDALIVWADSCDKPGSSNVGEEFDAAMQVARALSDNRESNETK